MNTILHSLVALLSLLQSPPPPETVTVHRMIVDVYATDGDGNPLRNLEARNFRVTVDGKTAEIDDVDFIESSPAGQDVNQKGRRLVLFFQRDTQAIRTAGHARMLDEAIAFVERLGVHDRVAVVSYDSHLKIRIDFTNDPVQVSRAIRATLRADRGEWPKAAEGDSLLIVSEEEARRCHTPERALGLLARALAPIDGSKSIILFGWGFGRYTELGVRMTRDYEDAGRALDDARVSVFSLDITDADRHSLEAGLQNASYQSGGFFVRTYDFPGVAMKRLERTLSARYELSVILRNVASGEHKVRVSLRDVRGDVMTRESYRLQ